MDCRHLLCLLSLFALLTACAAYPLKSHDDFRAALQQNPNMVGVRIEKFEVSRPMSQTAQFVSQKSNECLRHTIRITSKTSSGGYGPVIQEGLIKYEPHADISPTKATVYTTETSMNLKGEPTRDPYYTFVADFTPTSRNKTKVELYYVWGEPRPLVVKAVKAWAAGTDVGCPNLSKR
jgi:hypothetical protein